MSMVMNNTMRNNMRVIRSPSSAPPRRFVTQPGPRHSQTTTGLQPNLELPGFEEVGPAPEDLWRRFIRERFAPVWHAIRNMMLVPCDATSPGAGFDYVIVTELSAILSAMSEVHSHCIDRATKGAGRAFADFVSSTRYFPSESCWPVPGRKPADTTVDNENPKRLYKFIRCKHAHTLGMVEKSEEDIVIHRDRVTYADLMRVETSDERPEAVLPILRPAHAEENRHRWVLSINSLYWATYAAVRRLDRDMVADDAARRMFADTWSLSDHDQASGAAATNESPVSVVAADEVVSQHNKSVWDDMPDGGENRSARSSEVRQARRGGDGTVLPLAVNVALPSEWWGELQGKDVLCAASGGGFQGPILAAAGARVFVLDISPRQLARDRVVAEQHGLGDRITTIQADAAKQWPMGESSFDLVVIPFAVGLFKDVHHIWMEAHRVLRCGGCLIAGMTNPAAFLFDRDATQRGFPLAVHRLPYSDVERLDARRLRELKQRHRPLCYSHSLRTLIGGQITIGFQLIHVGELSDPRDHRDHLLMATEMATVAKKPECSGDGASATA